MSRFLIWLVISMVQVTKMSNLPKQGAAHSIHNKRDIPLPAALFALPSGRSNLGHVITKDSRPGEALALISNKWGQMSRVSKGSSFTPAPFISLHDYRGSLSAGHWSSVTLIATSWPRSPGPSLLSHSDAIQILARDPLLDRKHAAQLPRTGQDPQVQQQCTVRNLASAELSSFDLASPHAAPRLFLPQLLLTKSR